METKNRLEGLPMVGQVVAVSWSGDYIEAKVIYRAVLLSSEDVVVFGLDCHGYEGIRHFSYIMYNAKEKYFYLSVCRGSGTHRATLELIG